MEDPRSPHGYDRWSFLVGHKGRQIGTTNSVFPRVRGVCAGVAVAAVVGEGFVYGVQDLACDGIANCLSVAVAGAVDVHLASHPAPRGLREAVLGPHLGRRPSSLGAMHLQAHRFANREVLPDRQMYVGDFAAAGRARSVGRLARLATGSDRS